MKKSNIIISVLIVVMTLGVCGYSKSYSDIDPVEIINRLNGNTKREVPVNDQNTVPKTTPAPVKQQSIPQTNPQKPVTKPEMPKQTVNTSAYAVVSPIDIVRSPSSYIGKKVKFTAKFDKFSTLGLDYRPVMRSSENYITLLIQRPDVRTHNIPLSELKIFMDRKTAEKYIELNSGDEIEIAGRVISNALGDAWMDVDSFTVLRSIPKINN